MFIFKWGLMAHLAYFSADPCRARSLVELLSALPTYPVVCKSFFNFRDFLHSGTVFGGEHEFTGTRLENVFSSRGARKKFSIALLKMKYVKTSKLYMVISWLSFVFELETHLKSVW